MPVNDKNLGKYIGPAIIIEEVDKTQYIEPPVQEVLTNLVPGFSKKGPYNKPVKVSNANEFINTFGNMDRNLENKGSYFHKTVFNMLERGPVWALNLLKTDPTRDKVDWKSISVSSQYDNGVVKRAPYEYMFDRQDFWTLSSSELLDVVKTDNSGVTVTDKLLHITNVQDRDLTVFTFKSSITGFDVTAEFWYGGKENVPLYMNYNDWISDYMISILIVGGDWTDYAQLAVDPYWSKYFNTKGFIKTQLQNFVNEKNISVVGYYDVSLIPNFKDLNGKDMYVENVINGETDQTGLFCVYNDDGLLSTDSYMGRVDTLGQALVGGNKKDIDFMSYQDTIQDTKEYGVTHLDTLGNVFGNYDTDMTITGGMVNYRTAANTNWYTSTGITIASGDTIGNIDRSMSLSATTVDVVYTSGFTSDDAGLALNDIIYFTKSWGIIDSARAYYIVALDSGANSYRISTSLNGPAISGLDTGWVAAYNIRVYKLGYWVDILSDSYYNIGGVKYDPSNVNNGLTAILSPLSVSDSGGTYSRKDILYLTSDTTAVSTITGQQVSGGTAVIPNFTADNVNTILLGYVSIDYEVGAITVEYTEESVDENGYVPVIFGKTTGTTGGEYYLDITFTGSLGSSSVYNDYTKLRMNKIYDELATELAANKAVILPVTTDDQYGGTKVYVVSPTLIDPSTTTDGVIRIYHNSTLESYLSTDSDLLIYYIDNEFEAAGVTGGILTNNFSGATDIRYDYSTGTSGVSGATMGKYSSLYQDFYNGVISNYDFIYMNNNSGTTQQIYMKFVLSGETLEVGFLNQHYPVELPTTITWSNFLLTDGVTVGITIYSDISNWKQTVDITNIGITDVTNTRTIYVDKTRYSELVRGNFLEAYYDTTYYDSPGEGYVLGYEPKKFTRIISVTNSTDGVNKILSTDAPIKIYSYSGSTNLYYTNVYPSIDTYFDEYKGIFLSAFKVSDESIPDGTDARLDTIMSVVDKDTKIAKALSNKNRISWRYLVDSFGLGLTELSKHEFVDLCGAKLNCFGFINMPSVKQLKTSTNPSFINTDNTLNTTYLKEGGDDTKNPDFYYGFGDGVGQSCVGYFFPYLKDADDVTKFYPPSSYVARTYMNKFVSSTAGIKPWTIVAGTVYGIIPDVVSTEINLSDSDLDNLYQMGSNPIVYAMNRGFHINSENTAQVWPQTMLSLIHTREVLIELENRMYDMLLNYQWRFNNQDSRTEIKYRADQICKELKESGGLYDFKNVMDKTNNTNSIIEAQMGVLDTYAEIEKGMGIIVNQITILRKGVIESGGFLAS